MKNLIILLGLSVIFAACDNIKKDTGESAKVPATEVNTTTNVENVAEGAQGEFQFNEVQYDFGTVDEGEVVTHVFKFTNVGDGSLVIQNARGSCGCTVPNYSKQPVAPGETGEITVSFNTSGRPNAQSKTVTILANTEPAQTQLSIKAMVTPKSDPDQPMGPLKR
ncbi:MAG: DUF1573 domain-containing protein [Cyclobacteriaceae bacterium]